LIEFVFFAFSRQLIGKEGVVYNYYFEVFDNDLLHGLRVRSVVFSSRIGTRGGSRDQGATSSLI
jgi:hypothetical protein